MLTVLKLGDTNCTSSPAFSHQCLLPAFLTEDPAVNLKRNVCQRELGDLELAVDAHFSFCIFEVPGSLGDVHVSIENEHSRVICGLHNLVAEGGEGVGPEVEVMDNPDEGPILL